MKTVPKVVLLAFLATLIASGTINAQQDLPRIYVDVYEVQGLTSDGRIPIGGTDLVFPVRFTNVEEARIAISNGFEFQGDVTIGEITGAWNPAYPWNWELAFPAGCYPPVCYPYFDQGTFINYFADGVGFAGLTGAEGSGLPEDFDDIACYITLTGVTGDPCGVLIMDSTWWEPNNLWLWSGVAGDVSWGGPYFFEVGCVPCLDPPVITSSPVTETVVGEFYRYDVEAVSCAGAEYRLENPPEGMMIDRYTGLVQWEPTNPGIYSIHIVAYDMYGETLQTYNLAVIAPMDAYTTCWPQPTLPYRYTHFDENDGLLNIIIWNEWNDLVILESILVQGKLAPFTEARVEGDSIVTDVFLKQFIGISGWRPLPEHGFLVSTYSVEYDRLDGQHVVLTGDYVMCPPDEILSAYAAQGDRRNDGQAMLKGDEVLELYRGDVNFDGQVNDDDLQAMRDYLFNRGEVEFEELMDVDRDGQIDLMDMRELIKLIGGN